MQFSPFGGDWGTDQVSTSPHVDDIYRQNNRFTPLRKPRMNIPNAHTNIIRVPAPPTNTETFVGGGMPKMTGDMLIILLLVVLIIMNVLIYNSTRQTHETMNLILSILASKK